MRTVLVAFAVAGCSTASRTSSPPPVERVENVQPAPAAPAPPPKPVAVVRHDATRARLLEAAGDEMDERGYFKGRGPKRHMPGGCEAPVVETCAALAGDAEARVRTAAADCVGECSVAVGKDEPLYELAVDAIAGAFEREAHGGAALHQAYAVSSLLELGPRTAGRAGATARTGRAMVALLRGGKVQREAAAYVLGRVFRDDSVALPAEVARAILDILRTGDREVFDRVLAPAARIADQAAVCSIIAGHLRGDDERWMSAAQFAFDTRAPVAPCEGLLDGAIDLTIAKATENAEPLVMFDRADQIRDLPARTRKRIADALAAARPRARATERSVFDHYIQLFSRPRVVRGK
jgi:hypothetical protein